MRDARTRSPLLVTVLIAVASAAGIAAYDEPVGLGLWLLPSLLLLGVLTVLMVAMRAFMRSRLLPTVIGLVVMVAIAVPAYTDSGFPTPTGLRQLLDAIGEGAAHAATSAAPVTQVGPLTALVSVGLALLFLIAEHLAASWRATGLAGAFLLLPWLPAAVMPWSVPWLALVTAACAWLAALALTSTHDEVESLPRPVAWIGASAATVLLASLTAPLLIGFPGWGALPQSSFGTSSSTRLDLGLDLRDSLNVDSDTPVLTYVASGGQLDVLRLYTAESFNGSAWDRDDALGATTELGEGVLWPDLGLVTTEPSRTVKISIDTLVETALPITVEPRAVSVSDGWLYDAQSDEVRSSTTDTTGLTYTVTTSADYVTVDRLQSMEGDDDVDAETLEVPDAVDADRIRDLAEQIVADAAATSRYEQAVALQNWLRDPEEFTYDTTVALRGDDAVSEFLDTREGYCVQFATTMVMMARTLGIPARIGIGFLGGDQVAASMYQVVGGNAHAWPELYFPGTGWVRFEPTPAVQASVPTYATGGESGASPSPTPSPTSSSSVSPSPSDSPSASPSPSAAPSATAETDVDASAGTTAWPLAAALFGVIAAAAIAAWLLWRRRAAREGRASTVEGAWAHLRSRLPEPARWPESATPYEAAAHLRSQVTLPPDADAALDTLAEEVVRLRYLPPADASSLSEAAATATAHDATLKELADKVAEAARDGAKQ